MLPAIYNLQCNLHCKVLRGWRIHTAVQDSQSQTTVFGCEGTGGCSTVYSSTDVVCQCQDV